MTATILKFPRERTLMSKPTPPNDGDPAYAQRDAWVANYHAAKQELEEQKLITREMLQCLEAYAVPALNYLSIKATSAADRAEFKDRETKVRAAIVRARGAKS